MSKVKMRCIACGKWFQSANAKEVTCPDCVQKARKEKMAAKATPPSSEKAGGSVGLSAPARPTPPPPKPKPAQSGTNQWLDSLEDVRVAQPDQPQRPKLPPSPAARDNRSGQGGLRGPAGPGNYRDDRESRGTGGPDGYRESGSRGPGGYRENEYRNPGGGYRVGGGSGLPGTLEQRPRQPMEGGRGPRPGGGDSRQDKPRPRDGGGQKPKAKSAAPKPASPPKPKREKTPPPQPFVPTPEQITQVEMRYLELATPAEFDGIRTQISKELSIPKTAVKKIIKDLRDRQNIPSWWELQTYKGDAEELEKIKQAYEPFLPLPPVGVHKKIAEELSLKPGEVYQAIKAIRLEMNLPQYNDPALHGLELTPKKRENGQHPEEPASEAQTTPAETGTPPVDAVPTAVSETKENAGEALAAAVSDGDTPAKAEAQSVDAAPAAVSETKENAGEALAAAVVSDGDTPAKAEAQSVDAVPTAVSETKENAGEALAAAVVSDGDTKE